MKAFFKKMYFYGYRIVISYLAIKISMKIKVALYRFIYSDNRPTLINAKIITPVQYVGRGMINISSAQLGVWPSPHVFCYGYLESRNTESSIKIEEGTAINNNFTIIADKSQIRIGRRCLIGPNFYCVDSDFHGIEIDKRNSQEYLTQDVTIEDDVFIGEGVKVMKGVVIGRGAVIAAGSVVVGEVQAFSIYAGVPAKKISSLMLPPI